MLLKDRAEMMSGKEKPAAWSRDVGHEQYDTGRMTSPWPSGILKNASVLISNLHTPTSSQQ